MTDTNQNVQDEKTNTVTPAATAETASTEEKKVEASAVEVKAEEKKV